MGLLYIYSNTDSFRSFYDPGVESASNRNEYQEYFLGGKSGRCVRLTNLPPSCAVVMKSGNLNFLEPSWHLGPVMGLIYIYIYIYSYLYTNAEVPYKESQKLFGYKRQWLFRYIR
jgi:hypothetical protein